MRRNFVFIFALVCLGMPFAVHAQGIKAVHINEVLVYNDSGYQDDYGVRGGWFEIYNSGVKTLTVGGCYVTNDPSNPKKYRIPKTAQNATLPPKAYAVFFAYNEPTRGAFHVNFKLSDTGLVGGDLAYLALYDQSGKELIDSVTYHVSAQKPDCSFGKVEEDENGDWRVLEHVTPMTLNHISNDRSRSEIYGEKDPHGLIITATSVSVVFLLLFVIAVVFTCTGSYFKRKEAKEAQPAAKGPQASSEKPAAPASQADGDIPAVIAAALYLYQQDCHEEEETGFYLNRGINQSTPWSSKSLNFKRTPIRK